MRKILLLVASPKNSTRLRSGEGVRDIREGIKRAKHRADFQLVEYQAVRPLDFQRAILEELPQIVHITSQVAGQFGLYLEDEDSNPQRVSDNALADLFELCRPKVNIECVVLDGCYAQSQAQAISQYTSYVIGLQEPIEDDSANAFAVGFYDSLGRGETIEEAFNAGKVAIAFSDQSAKSSEGMAVILKGEAVAKASNHVVYDKQVGILEARQAYQTYLIQLVEKDLFPFSEDTKLELLKLKHNLGLSDSEVVYISQPILELAEKKEKDKRAQKYQQLYEKNRLHYQQEFEKEALQEWPLTAIAKSRLQMLKIKLRLTDETVSQIENHLIKALKIEVLQARKTTLTDPILPINYSKLTHALNEENWKEADLETYSILIESIENHSESSHNPDVEPRMTSDNIEKLPKSLLIDIDQLWMKHSQGKFGLSVQKSIWEDVNQRKGGKNTQFYDFFHRIGWFRKEERDWIPFSQFTFDLESAPKGHFPSLGYGQRKDRYWKRYWENYFKVLWKYFNTCLEE